MKRPIILLVQTSEYWSTKESEFSLLEYSYAFCPFHAILQHVVKIFLFFLFSALDADNFSITMLVYIEGVIIVLLERFV